MNRWRFGLIMICTVAALLSGCGVKDKVAEVKGVAEAVVEQVQEAATEVATAPQVAATDTPAPKVAEQKAAPTATTAKATAEPTEEPEEEGPPELKSLEGVESYRQNMINTIEVDGKRTIEWNMMSEYDPATPALRFVMSGIGEDGQPFESETIQIGDVMYTRYDDQWTAMQFSDQDIAKQISPWTDSQQWVNDDCQRKGKETVAGESTTHYQCDIDTQILTQAMMSKEAEVIEHVTADFWISEKYDVAVKSIIAWDGKDKEGRQVVYRYEMLTEDIGMPITIAKPEGVDEPGVGIDLPVFVGAEQVVAMPNMITYEVEADIDDVSQFYQDELAKVGWTLNADGSMAPMIMAFTKDGQSLNVMLNQDGAKVSIILMTE